MKRGETVVEVLVNDELRGYIRIADKIRSGAIDTINKLKKYEY